MIEPWMLALGINALLFASAWGDLRSQVRGNRTLQDERHEDNRNRLERIEQKVDRINGTVAEHEGILKTKPKRTRR